MKKYRVTVNSKEHLVTLTRREKNSVSFVINNKNYDVLVQPEGQNQSPFQSKKNGSPNPLSTSAAASKSGLIVSPMPGIVSTICVEVGADVKSGDTLIVIEAMKMENNVTALRSGKVQEIKVAVGEEVNHGQGLVLVA
jgi:biotin carboxyl carrier protein